MLTQLRNHFRAPYNLRHLGTYAGAVILPDMLGRFLVRLLSYLEIPIAVAIVITGMVVIEFLSCMFRKMGFSPFSALIVSVGTLCVGLPSWPGMQPELGREFAILSMIFGVGLSYPIFMREMHEFAKQNQNY